MNELIKVTQNSTGQDVVSARELHKFLELDKSQVSRWLDSKIFKNGFFTENEDFVRLDIFVEGQQTIDYAITLEIAKRLCMMTKSKKGEEIRSYFIECEKTVKDLQEINYKPMNQLEMISFMALSLNNQKIEQEKQAIQLVALTAKVDAMEQDYFSVQGYANLHKIKIDHATCNKLGRKASKMSREENAKIGKAKHQIYGEVNTYHEDILKDIFDEWLNY